MVSLLMPSFTHHQPSSGEPSHEQLQRSSVVRCALEACCPIIAYSCTDAVLKVYLATLVSELLLNTFVLLYFINKLFKDLSVSIMLWKNNINIISLYVASLYAYVIKYSSQCVNQVE